MLITLERLSVFKILLCLLVSLFSKCNAQAQKFNFQPCYQYWTLTDQLRNGVKPTAEEWDKLRQADGYKRKYVPPEAWTGFIDRVSLVYSPGNEEAVNQRIKTDPSLQYIVRFAKEESRLKKHISELEGMHLMDSAKIYVQRMLPPKWKNCFREPTVDFILYDYDASGSKHGIVMDLLVSYDLDRFKPGAYLGHELLHYALAYCSIKTRNFKYVPEEHQAVFNAVNGISEEGTADLIDKPYLLFDNRSPWLIKDTVMIMYTTQSEVFIHRLNEGLEKLADAAQERYTTGAYWNSVNMPGHIPGMYMGRVIQQNGLVDKLIKQIDNPFAFFYLYNEAAKKDESAPPVFSKKALRFIRLMERRYR